MNDEKLTELTEYKPSKPCWYRPLVVLLLVDGTILDVKFVRVWNCLPQNRNLQCDNTIELWIQLNITFDKSEYSTYFFFLNGQWIPIVEWVQMELLSWQSWLRRLQYCLINRLKVFKMKTLKRKNNEHHHSLQQKRKQKNNERQRSDSKNFQSENDEFHFVIKTETKKQRVSTLV